MSKAPIDIRSLARKHTDEAIDRLVYWMRSDNGRSSVGAATALLDRGWGKPAQGVELTGKDGGAIEMVNLDTPTRARALAAFVAKTMTSGERMARPLKGSGRRWRSAPGP